MTAGPVDDAVKRIFNERDYRNFRWVFCRNICEIGNEPVTDYQLFLRSGFEGYMGNEELMKDYVLDNARNVYKVFIDRVLRSLVDRDLLRETRTNYGGLEMVSYESTDLMRRNCHQFMRFLMGDVDMLQ